MANEQLIWFDVTTSLHWARPAVGVVRVEQECCRWLITKLGDRVRPCIFDPSADQFSELGIEETWKILRRDWSASGSEPATHPPAAPVIAPTETPAAPKGLARHIERFLRKAALTILATLPRTMQPKVRSHLIAIRRTLAYAYLELKAARARGTIPPPLASAQSEPIPESPCRPTRPRARFQQGDSYVSMGLDWDHGNKMDVLYREKRKSGLKVFSFAHDVIPVKFPHYHSSGKFDLFSVYFTNMGWTADRIICNSECTAHDLRNFLNQVGAPCPPTTIVRLGDTLPGTNDSKPSPEVESLLGTPFLLTVSTIEIRKNHESLYRAYVRLIEAGFDVPTLVLVGMTGWRVDDFLYSLRNDPRVLGKIMILNHVTDADLSLLYRNCLFTLYPSLYEGWGLPVAESLAYGKLCLASNAASIPEIAGDIIDYVDAWDVPQWAEKIQLYCTDPMARRAKEQLISSHYRLTPWESTADQVIATIESTPTST